MKKIPGTNVHNLDEPIELVSWRGPRGFGRYHIARPRSQRGVSYCSLVFADYGPPERNRENLRPHGQRQTIQSDAVAANVLELSDVCGNCARQFVLDTAKVHGGERYHELPDVWRAIFKRRRRTEPSDPGKALTREENEELEDLLAQEVEYMAEQVRDEEHVDDSKGGPF